MVCLGKSLIIPSQCQSHTVISLKHSHPPTPCVQYSWWRAQTLSPASGCPLTCWLHPNQDCIARLNPLIESTYITFSSSLSCELVCNTSSHSLMASQDTPFLSTTPEPIHAPHPLDPTHCQKQASRCQGTKHARNAESKQPASPRFLRPSPSSC